MLLVLRGARDGRGPRRGGRVPRRDGRAGGMQDGQGPRERERPESCTGDGNRLRDGNGPHRLTKTEEDLPKMHNGGVQQKRLQRRPGCPRSRMVEGRTNSPTFIYSVLHDVDETSAPFIEGLAMQGKERREIGGIMIDANIPHDAIVELMKIKDVEIRSVSEGSDKDHPTFLIFRIKGHETPSDGTAEYIDAVVDAIDDGEYFYAGSGAANDGTVRIGVTTELWYEQDPVAFNLWWNILAVRIADAFD